MESSMTIPREARSALPGWGSRSPQNASRNTLRRSTSHKVSSNHMLNRFNGILPLCFPPRHSLLLAIRTFPIASRSLCFEKSIPRPNSFLTSSSKQRSRSKRSEVRPYWLLCGSPGQRADGFANQTSKNHQLRIGSKHRSGRGKRSRFRIRANSRSVRHRISFTNRAAA